MLYADLFNEKVKVNENLNIDSPLYLGEKMIGKKMIVVGVVALLCLVTIKPTIGNHAKVIEVKIAEYKPDGSIEIRNAKLTQKEAIKFKEEFLKAKTIEEKFSLLKEYGFIPKKNKLSDWENGMYERAKLIGLSMDKIKQIISNCRALGIFKLPILLNLLCKVNAVYLLGGEAHLGFPPITGLSKFVGGWKAFSFDVVDMSWGVFGFLETKGLLRSKTMVSIPSFMYLAGFVGVHICIPLLLNTYTGFSAFAFGAGFGMQDIRLNLFTAALLGFIAGATAIFILTGFTEGG